MNFPTLDFSTKDLGQETEQSGVEKFMVQNSVFEKSGVGKFMVEKSGVERSGVEAWG